MAILDTYRYRPGFGDSGRPSRPTPIAPSRPSVVPADGARSRERAARAIANERAAAAVVDLPRRIGAVCAVVGCSYVVLMGQLAHIQILQNRQYNAEAKAMRRKTVSLTSSRGVLLDRNGTLLVENEPASTICIDPNSWGADLKTGESFDGRKAAAIAKLQQLLPGVSVAAVIDEKLEKAKKEASGKTHFRPFDLARRVPLTVGADITKANLPGVAVVGDFVRKAINGDLAPQIVGFTGQAGNGLDGLEKVLDKSLVPKPGFITAEFDRSAVPIPGTEYQRRDAEAGCDTVLTLDAQLQQAAETSLGNVFQSTQAEAATVVILDPKTGDILAMADRPTYNVNHRDGTPLDARMNRAVSAPYEPGSTLKMITMAAGLEEKVVTPDTHFYCGGSLPVGNRIIHCAHGEVHHDETSVDVIRNSCNVATAEIAFKLGKQRLYDYEKKFGFGEKTGSGLPGESRGLIAPADRWSEIQQANVAFGQGISVTPLQLAAAYASIANDGKYCTPRIVLGRRDPQDGLIKEDKPLPARQVVSVETAREVRYMLQQVVDNGTGTKAQLSQWTAGGKTGTAQIAEHGHYANKYVSSFIGITPMSDPKFVILVTITAPKGLYFGGVVAAPIFKEIAEKALLAGRVNPDKQPAAPTGKSKLDSATGTMVKD